MALALLRPTTARRLAASTAYRKPLCGPAAPSPSPSPLPAVVLRRLLSSASTTAGGAAAAGPGKVLKRVRVAKKKGSDGGGGGSSSWRDRWFRGYFKKKPPPENLVPGRKLAAVFAGASAFQLAFGIALIATEATLEKNDQLPPPELMTAGLVLGLGASGALFRQALKPHFARYRWYAALVFMNLQLLPAANLFVRTYLIPDLPVLEEHEKEGYEIDDKGNGAFHVPDDMILIGGVLRPKEQKVV